MNFGGERADQMSRSDLADLRILRDAEAKRTGESPSAIYCHDVINMGDFSAQQLAIGKLEFPALALAAVYLCLFGG